MELVFNGAGGTHRLRGGPWRILRALLALTPGEWKPLFIETVPAAPRADFMACRERKTDIQLQIENHGKQKSDSEAQWEKSDSRYRRSADAMISSPR